MPTKNPEVDQYIAEAAEFAQPILKRLRSAFHQGCPQAAETIKWGIPNFEYHGIVGSMAAFKQHVSVGFWRSKEMKDSENILERRAASMSNIKFTELKEVPSVKVLASYVAQAAALNETAKSSPKNKKKASKPLPPVPAALENALTRNKKAKSIFDNMSTTQKRDYIEWIAEAKREETVAKRVTTAIEWISEGKGRNWKYETANVKKKKSPKKK